MKQIVPPKWACLRLRNFLSVFLIESPDSQEEIPSLPGVYRMGVNVLMKTVSELVPKGLQSILLFAVTNLPKVIEN